VSALLRQQGCGSAVRYRLRQVSRTAPPHPELAANTRIHSLWPLSKEDTRVPPPNHRT